MKLSYNLKNKSVDTKELLDKYCGKEIDEAALLKEFAYAEFYYSTFGDDLYSGNQQQSTAYLPLFVSKAEAKDYYDKRGRKDCVIIKKSFLSIIDSTLKTDLSDSTVKLGLIIDPSNYRLRFDIDTLYDAKNMILRENDTFLHHKKTYLMMAVTLSVLLAVCAGLIFCFSRIIDGLSPDCRVESAAVINVDTKKNKVIISCRGEEYILKGISNGNIWSYASDQIHGKQIKVYIKDGTAYADYKTLKYDTSIYGKLYFYSIYACVALIFLTGLCFGGFIEAKKREKIYEKAIEQDHVIRTDN